MGMGCTVLAAGGSNVVFSPQSPLPPSESSGRMGPINRRARARTRQHMSTKTNPIVLYNERPTRQAGSSNQLRRLSEINIT